MEYIGLIVSFLALFYIFMKNQEGSQGETVDQSHEEAPPYERTENNENRRPSHFPTVRKKVPLEKPKLIRPKKESPPSFRKERREEVEDVPTNVSEMRLHGEEAIVHRPRIVSLLQKLPHKSYLIICSEVMGKPKGLL